MINNYYVVNPKNIRSNGNFVCRFQLFYSGRAQSLDIIDMTTYHIPIDSVTYTNFDLLAAYYKRFSSQVRKKLSTRSDDALRSYIEFRMIIFRNLCKSSDLKNENIAKTIYIFLF